jgi:hypothetical protein
MYGVMHKRRLHGFGDDTSTDSWSEAAKFIQSLGTTGTQAYANILKAQQPVAPKPVVSQTVTNWSNILLYGGIAVGAVVLLMYVMKKKG